MPRKSDIVPAMVYMKRNDRDKLKQFVKKHNYGEISEYLRRLIARDMADAGEPISFDDLDTPARRREAV